MSTFSVWAPEATRARVRIADVDHEMRRDAGSGWWRAELPGHGPGTDYRYLLDNSTVPLPDPRSLWQPAGVQGPSRVYDHAAFNWTDQGWLGKRLPGNVLYEIHTATFTPQGTFDAAIGHLDHVRDLGVDFVELLAVTAFHSAHHWYAPHAAYGGPDGLKRFVDTCHRRGLGVILQVPYHHTGPPNDAEGIRRYLVDNVVMWLRDYHLDGLRLDAVHPLSEPDVGRLLNGLAAAVEQVSAEAGRPLSLIDESDRSDPRLLAPRDVPGQKLHHLWSDDAVRTVLASARHGYSAAFAAHLKHHAGVGGPDGPATPAGDATPPPGLSPKLLRVGATLLLTAPFTPTLFMGEEWAASTPWQPRARQSEPAMAGLTGGPRPHTTGRGRPPVAGDAGRRPEAATARSALDWSELDQPGHREMLDLYRGLIALRRANADLADPWLYRVDAWHGTNFLAVRRGRCVVATNLGEQPQRIALRGVGRTVLFATESGVALHDDAAQLPGESAAVIACDRTDGG